MFQIKYWLSQKINKIRSEKLTIMLLPHSGSRGLSFHINYLNIYYFLFLISIFIFLSIYIKPHTDSLKEQEDNLLKIKAMDNVVLKEFKENFEQMGIALLNMQTMAKEIYNISDQVPEREAANLEKLYKGKNDTWVNSFFERKRLKFTDLKHKLVGSLKIMQTSRRFYANTDHFDPDKITLFPVNDGYIVRGYDMSIPHIGLDIGASYGTPVDASASGRVILADWFGNYGLTVILKHKDGSKTLYAHNSRLNAQLGDWIDKGSTIAYVGTTGRSSGFHLHFEVRLDEKAVDPLPYVKFFVKRARVHPEYWTQISKNWKGGP